MENLYIRFDFNKDDGVFIECQIGNEVSGTDIFEDKDMDRRVVRILRKYLDLELSSQGMDVFERGDFETLGGLLSGIWFDLKNHKNLNRRYDKFFRAALGDDNKDGSAYNIFLSFRKNKNVEELAALPWEYITYKPELIAEQSQLKNQFFIATCKKTMINFYRQLCHPGPMLNKKSKEYMIEVPLKILIIISEATSNENGNAAGSRNLGLNKKNEVITYFMNLANNHGEDVLQIKYLIQPSASIEGFTNELKNGLKKRRKFIYEKKDLHENVIEHITASKHTSGFEPDIIHFVGHGYVKGENGGLILSKESDFDNYIKKPMKDIHFAQCIEDSGLEPKLVLLHTCNGGRVVNYTKGGGLAFQLLSENIPFVIAMQNAIQEAHALTFIKTFYNNFLQGKDIGKSVTMARYALSNEGEFDQKVFGSPVLYAYSDIPLKIGRTVSESAESGTYQEEKIIKICNNSRCPFFRTEVLYEPAIIKCLSCTEPIDSKVRKITSHPDSSQRGSMPSRFDEKSFKPDSDRSLSRPEETADNSVSRNIDDRIDDRVDNNDNV